MRLPRSGNDNSRGLIHGGKPNVATKLHFHQILLFSQILRQVMVAKYPLDTG